MTKEWNCLRCGHQMDRMKQEHLFLGQVAVLFGTVHSVADKGFPVDIYCCPTCRKLEFYLPEPEEETDSGGIEQITCPSCGTKHDMDDPKCPSCGAKNSMLYE